MTATTSMDPENAVRRAIDGDALLEGEDPESPHLEDAEHWVNVYRELIAFKQSLLDSTNHDTKQLEHPEARQEAASVDGTILRAELERFRRRVAFWEERRSELTQRTGF